MICIRALLSLAFFFAVIMVAPLAAAVSFTSIGSVVEVDFDDYAGTGFQPGGGGGTLDSDLVSAQLDVYDADFNLVFGGAVPYGGSVGPSEFGRGVASTLPSDFGLFALDLGGGDYALAGRSYEGGADESFSAYVEVRILNDTGATLTQVRVEYDLLYFNSADSSIYADGHIGSNDVGLSDVDALLFETPEDADSLPTWTSTYFDAYFYLPYFGFDLVEPVEPGEYLVVGLSVGGSPSPVGRYDSVAWNNIRVTALPEPGSLTIGTFLTSVLGCCRGRRNRV